MTDAAWVQTALFRNPSTRDHSHQNLQPLIWLPPRSLPLPGCLSSSALPASPWLTTSYGSAYYTGLQSPLVSLRLRLPYQPWYRYIAETWRMTEVIPEFLIWGRTKEFSCLIHLIGLRSTQAIPFPNVETCCCSLLAVFHNSLKPDRQEW